jgi:iron(III) transport system permease protein
VDPGAHSLAVKTKGGLTNLGGFFLCLAAAFVFVLPVLRLLWTSLHSGGGFSLEAYRDILGRPATWKASGNSLYIGLASTLGAMVLGLGLSWLVAYTDIRFTKAIWFLTFLPYILPSYSIALAWRLFCSPNGAVAALVYRLPGAPAMPSMYSYGGIIFVHIVSAFSPVFLLMSAALQRVPQDMEWAARAAGVKSLSIFWRINVPLIAPSFISAAFLTFLSVIDNFGIPAILGIPAGIQVLPTYIYEQIAGLGSSVFSRAAVLSLILIAMSFLGFAAQKLLLRKPWTLEAVRPEKTVRVSLGKARTPLSVLIVFLLLFLSVIPVFSMTGTALKKAMGLPFQAGNITLNNFVFVLLTNAKSRRAMANSLGLAAFTAAVCMILGTALAVGLAKRKSRWPAIIEAMIQIPYSIPGIVLSLCMILFWLQPLPGVFPGVYGTVKILFIVYLTRFLVVQSKASFSAIAGFDPGLEDAVRSSGCSPLWGWVRIILPLLLPGIISGAVMVFTGVLTELTLSSLIWSAGAETIGTTILNFEQAGTLKYSSALSSAVCVLVILLFVLSRLPGSDKTKTM